MARILINKRFSPSSSISGPFSGIKLTWNHPIYDQEPDWEADARYYEYQSHDEYTVCFEGPDKSRVREKIDITLDYQSGGPEPDATTVQWKTPSGWVTD